MVTVGGARGARGIFRCGKPWWRRYHRLVTARHGAPLVPTSVRRAEIRRRGGCRLARVQSPPSAPQFGRRGQTQWTSRGGTASSDGREHSGTLVIGGCGKAVVPR